jgi:hypothetical protein
MICRMQQASILPRFKVLDARKIIIADQAHSYLQAHTYLQVQTKTQAEARKLQCFRNQEIALTCHRIMAIERHSTLSTTIRLDTQADKTNTLKPTPKQRSTDCSSREWAAYRRRTHQRRNLRRELTSM